MTNTEIRAWLKKAKTQPITAGLALEMMPMIEDLLGRVDILEIADRTVAIWMDVVDEMSFGRGDHTVDFYVLDEGGKTVIEPRKVEGIYKAMRQHFSEYRTSRVERAEHGQYQSDLKLQKIEAILKEQPND